jgi:hypothetical protein
MVTATAQSPDLSLLGGPFHQLGCRLGLVRNWSNTAAFGLAIGLLLWVVGLVLVLLGGDIRGVFSLAVIGTHIRLLVVIPLLFVCESMLDPRLSEFTRFLVRWRLVPEEGTAALNAAIERVNWWQRSWFPDVVCAVAAVILSFAAEHLRLGGNTTGFSPENVATGGAAAIWWYSAVALPVFRFLMMRWLWRIAMWTYFLWRVSRLKLHLLPTHPDCVGGLGFLEVVHTQFVPLILAGSALRAGTVTEDVVTGDVPFESLYMHISIVLAVNAALFLGPLLVLAPKLWACRVQGMRTYMGLAERYMRQFDKKWLGTTEPQEQLLGTPDIQSLADLTSSVNNVRDMRWAPISLRLVVIYLVAALLPFAPVLLLKYPITDLTRNLFTGLLGL